MKQERYYLPFPLFLSIFAVIGLGFWYAYKIYVPLMQPIEINEISDNQTAAQLACVDKISGTSCEYEYCPPMPICPEGQNCAQVMPPCIQNSGTCQSSICSTILEVSPSPSNALLGKGDINNDKIIDLLDYELFVLDYGKNSTGSSDIFRDGIIDLKDYNLFVQNFGQTSP